jgi:APA family basic amino acid/polyamine antiporter
LLTVWGFVGLECATTVAGAIKNPSKTIPRALIFGTSAVAFLYFFNVLSIMGLINGTELMNMRSPYVDAVKNIIGGNWHLAISLGSSIVCVGTLNAWTLVSGQIAFGLGQSSLLPRIFTKQNKNGAPIFALCVSSVGTVILLAMTIDDNIVNQVTNVINFSATSFLFVYLICSLALIKFLLSRSQKLSYTKLSGSIIAAVFSLWVIYETPLDTLAIAATFTLSGIPVYWLWYRKRDKALD